MTFDEKHVVTALLVNISNEIMHMKPTYAECNEALEIVDRLVNEALEAIDERFPDSN